MKNRQKQRKRKNNRPASTTATPRASRVNWRLYSFGFIAILGVVALVAMMRPAASTESVETAVPAAVLPEATEPIAAPIAAPEPQQVQQPLSATQAAATAAAPDALPKPQSELERIAQSAALATAARISGGGKVTPSAFPLPSLQGMMLGPSDYPGKVVVVNFWATWCGPCKREIPALMDLYADYRSSGLEVLGVALDTQGQATVKPYSEGAGINYPVLIGNPQVSAIFKITAIPTTVIYDRQGKLHKQLVGEQSREALEGVIKPLL